MHWMLFSQTITLPDPPKTGDGSWVSYLVSVLGLLICVALGYLIRVSSKNEEYATKSLDKLIKTLEDNHAAAEVRLNTAWIEHDKDRVAFMHQQEEIARQLAAISQDTAKHAGHLSELTMEVRKRRPAGGNGG